jgi:ABC-type transporter Mla subunit MlaD
VRQTTLFIRVGALLAATAVALVLLIMVLTGDRLNPGVEYESYFRESVQGLEVGSPVKYRGVTLGHVTKIGLVAAEYGEQGDAPIDASWFRLIVVRYKLNPKQIGRLPDADSIVKDGLRVRLANQGLTGVMYLELDFVQATRNALQTLPWTPLVQYIPSVPSTISQVQENVTRLLDKIDQVDLNAITKNIDGLVSDVRHDIKEGDVHAALGQAQAAIADVRAQLKVADLAALSQQLQKTAASVQTLADGRQTRAVVQQAEISLQKVPALIASLQRTADRASGGVADLQSELLPILQDARAAMQNLRETTETIRRDPGSVLLQGPPPRERAR